MSNINVEFAADIVIAPVPFSSAYSVWQDGNQIATGSAAAARLIASGASASKLSVYDLDSGCFLCGTVDQLGGRPA